MIRYSLRYALLIWIALSARHTVRAVDFETQIRPLLKQHCAACHGPLKQASGLRLDAKAFAFRDGDSGPVIMPGKSGDSQLWQRITSDDDSVRMPPEGQPLTAAEKALIKEWIDTGAVWLETDEDRAAASHDARLDHWAWQPLSSAQPPDSSTINSRQDTFNEIDFFLAAKLKQLGLQFSPPADRRTLIRRLSFDLLGLPPTPEQVREFELDQDSQAYEHLVERLLNSPRYGERAAQHWLDIAHYADTHGFERDQIREHAWRYRDWVIDAFNRDLAYDEFIRRQIAGDALDIDDPQSVLATGFLAAGPWDFVGQAETPSPVLKRLARADDLDDMVTQVMAATMGVTINCARCHDHKLDPISQREYYSICAVFAGVKRGNRAISRAAEKTISDTKAELSQEIDSLKRQLRRSTLSGWDLADIVGGGNGLGTGQANAGLDPATGAVIKETRGFLDGAAVNKYAHSPLPIIDGVAIPGGTMPDGLVISTTGVRALDLPGTSGKAWDAIRNGPVNSQFSTKLAGTEFNDGTHALLSLHANALITLDLSELPALPGQATLTQKDGSCVGHSATLGKRPKRRERVVLLDGKSVVRRESLGRDDGLQTMDVAIPADARFLTLAATDNGNDISHDQICFVDLYIAPAQSQPTTTTDAQALAELKQKIEALSKQLASVSEAEQVYAVVSEAPPKVSLLARGDTEQPLEEVQPSALACIAGLKNFSLSDTATDYQRRLELAGWITADDNPLVARVIVNRLWQQHFGVGIVATPSDFGLGGSLPSHPELLDWLAQKLKSNHYSLKAIHRLICCSQAYRQQSTLNAQNPHHQAALSIDGSNRNLWRQNPQRLDAESLRDALLAVSGQLDERMFGPGFRDFDYKEEYAPVYSYVTKQDPALFRRTIYRFRVRTTPNPWLTTLDCPNPANLTPTRNTTTTALQSLAMLNHDFVLQQAGAMARRLEQAPHDPVELAWGLVFSRQPTRSERSAAQAFIDQHGLSAFCRYLLNANEFITID